jgi:hypothetical protein
MQPPAPVWRDLRGRRAHHPDRNRTDRGAAIDFSARQIRSDQIIESLQEFCQNWFARGMARDASAYEQRRDRIDDPVKRRDHIGG